MLNVGVDVDVSAFAEDDFGEHGWTPEYAAALLCEMYDSGAREIPERVYFAILGLPEDGKYREDSQDRFDLLERQGAVRYVLLSNDDGPSLDYTRGGGAIRFTPSNRRGDKAKRMADSAANVLRKAGLMASNVDLRDLNMEERSDLEHTQRRLAWQSMQFDKIRRKRKLT